MVFFLGSNHLRSYVNEMRSLKKRTCPFWGFGHTLAAWNIGKWYVGSMIENMHLIYEHLAVHSKNIHVYIRIYIIQK